MSSTVDLDAFLTEVIGEGQVIRLYGRDWRLKSEVPALLMLRLQRELDSDDDTLEEEKQLALLRAMFDPPSQVDEMVDAGLGWSALIVVTQVAIGVLSGRSADDILADLRKVKAAEAASGEAGGPTEAPTSSRTTGPTSKRTSSRSTASGRKR